MDSVPGGGAEILVDRVRKLCTATARRRLTSGSMSCVTRTGRIRTTATMSPDR